MKKATLGIIVILSIFTFAFAAEKRPMTVEDLWAMKRIGQVALSPDGQWLAYELMQYDMEKNSGNSDLWLVPTLGGEPKQLTVNAKFDGIPRWKPDGNGLGFISARDGSRQIYLLPMSGGEAKKITDFPVDVEDFIWSPDGQHIAFSAAVYADAKDLQETADRDKSREESKVMARIIDHLMFRSFDRWTEGKRTHVFVCTSGGKNVVDVTPGDYDSPPLDLGGSRDFVFSPDGKEIAFVRNPDPMVAASTNNDVFIVPMNGGEAKNITAANKAVDNQPFYSPDGKYLAYKAMKRPGFEADQYEIMLYDQQTGQQQSLTDSFDLTPEETVWSPDGQSIFFTAENQGRNSIFVIDVANKQITELVHDHDNGKIIVGRDGKTLYFSRETVAMPEELFRLVLKSKTEEQLTFVNQELLSRIKLNPVEDFWFSSFDGKKAHGLLLKPPFFDPDKKYPLIFLIHGGPQGQWSDDFHYRWNASLFAAPGYVVAMINFRGSRGYGQAWCDAVSKDWGGGPYRDLMVGLDYLLSTYPFIDKEKLAAAGASYGGFMIDWIATHTDRFNVLVSHAGVFDQRSMYGATEELWFPEWEFGGTPYEQPELYEKWSPSYYAADFKKYKTPTLVIAGEQDYRVPVTQGLQMFTAMQRMGVPSRLIYFPDETHFVSKPQNSRLWWNEVFAWIDKWLKK
jgi:dipeptidyl aminopeptidase/acylaminoacyl peptidase